MFIAYAKQEIFLCVATSFVTFLVVAGADTQTMTTRLAKRVCPTTDLCSHFIY